MGDGAVLCIVGYSAASEPLVGANGVHLHHQLGQLKISPDIACHLLEGIFTPNGEH